MPLSIIGFAKCLTNHLCIIYALNRKVAEKKVFRIEQENQFVEPIDKERDCIMALNSNLAASQGAHFLSWNEKVLHALSCMNEQFWQCVTEGMQTYIGSVFEY